MGTIASQITSFTIVYTTVYSSTDQRKYQSSASLAFVRGIHRGPVNSPHKGPVTRKMIPFDDVIMEWNFRDDHPKKIYSRLSSGTWCLITFRCDLVIVCRTRDPIRANLSLLSDTQLQVLIIAGWEHKITEVSPRCLVLRTADGSTTWIWLSAPVNLCWIDRGPFCLLDYLGFPHG